MCHISGNIRNSGKCILQNLLINVYTKYKYTRSFNLMNSFPDNRAGFLKRQIFFHGKRAATVFVFPKAKSGWFLNEKCWFTLTWYLERPIHRMFCLVLPNIRVKPDQTVTLNYNFKTQKKWSSGFLTLGIRKVFSLA